MSPIKFSATHSSLSVTFKYLHPCVCFPADPPRVYEAVTGLSELCAEERRAASGSRCLVGRPGLPEAADQLHGRRREPRLLLPTPAATGETTHTHRATQRSPLITSPIGWFEPIGALFGLVPMSLAQYSNILCIIKNTVLPNQN